MVLLHGSGYGVSGVGFGSSYSSGVLGGHEVPFDGYSDGFEDSGVVSLGSLDVDGQHASALEELEPSLYFDNVFATEFKRSLASLSKVNSRVFNLSILDIEPTPFSDDLQFLCYIRGVSKESIFHELESSLCFVTTRKSVGDCGFYAFSYKGTTLKAPKGFRTVATNKIISVPNGYTSPDSSVRYIATERLDNSIDLQYYWVSEDILYRKPTYVVTVSLNRVANHLGGRELILTNGSKLYLVIQDRSKMRNTDTKNIYYIEDNIESCTDYIAYIHDFLVHSGFAFNYSLFNVRSESDGLVVDYNLTYKDLNPTMDLIDAMVEMPLSEEG